MTIRCVFSSFNFSLLFFMYSAMILYFSDTFLVRAVSDYGHSFPSPWSKPIMSQKPIYLSVSMEEVRHARRRLARHSLSLSGATSTSPDSVLLTWDQMNSASDEIEGGGTII